MILTNKKYLLTVVFLGLAFGLGLLAEYKLGVLNQIQVFRNRPAELPRLPLDLALGFSGGEKIDDSPMIDPPLPGGYSAWRNAVRERISKEIGIVITRDKQPVNFRLVSEKELERVRQQFVIFTSFDGTQIPAYIHSPIDRNGLLLPGIVVVPGHVMEGESGIEQLANQPESYQHAAAARLAEAGFVTLTFELRGFGYMGRPFDTEHVLVAYNALLQGHSYKALVIQDTQVAVAMLRTIEGVDEERIGIAGTSYGGEIAVSYAALDESIKAIVAHSDGGDSGRKGLRRGGRNRQPHYCHFLPVVDSLVRGEYWYWMLAPRPVLGIRGELDDPDFAQILDFYQQGWEGEEGLDLRVQSGGHEFFVQPTIEFFEQYLK